MSKTIDYINDIFNWSYAYSCNLYKHNFSSKTIPTLGLTNKEKELLVSLLKEFSEKYLLHDECIKIDIRGIYPEASEEQIELLASVRRMLINILYNAIDISIYLGVQFITLHEIVLALKVFQELPINPDDIQWLSLSLVGYFPKEITIPCDPICNKRAYDWYKNTAEEMQTSHKEDEPFNVPTYLITNEEMEILSTYLMDFVVSHREIDYGVSEEEVAKNKKVNPDFSDEACRCALEYQKAIKTIFANTIKPLNSLKVKNITIDEIIEFGFIGLKQFNIPGRLISELQGKIVIEIKASNVETKISMNEIDERQNGVSQIFRLPNTALRVQERYDEGIILEIHPGEGEDPFDVIDDILGIYDEKKVKSRVS